MKSIILLLFLLLCIDRTKYCIQTKDYSLQGYWENLKKRFWYKKPDTKE